MTMSNHGHWHKVLLLLQHASTTAAVKGSPSCQVVRRVLPHLKNASRTITWPRNHGKQMTGKLTLYIPLLAATCVLSAPYKRIWTNKSWPRTQVKQNIKISEYRNLLPKKHLIFIRHHSKQITNNCPKCVSTPCKHASGLYDTHRNTRCASHSTECVVGGCGRCTCQTTTFSYQRPKTK